METDKYPAYNSPLAKRMRQIILEQKAITMTGIAKKTGMKRQQISDYANGKTVPKADAITKIAQAMNVSADYLLGLSDDKKQKGNSTNLETCMDAIRCIDALLKIKGSWYSYNPPEDIGDGYSDPSIGITLTDPGIVKYYTAIEQVNKAVKSLPDSVLVSAWQFQYDAAKRLTDEAEKTKLCIEKYGGFVEVDEEDLPF